MKALAAYFSHTGENYSVGNIKKGNTEIIAEIIAEKTGADLFEIKTVKPYPDDYTECVEVAKREKNSDSRPELTATVKNMADYDVVFLGYPIWWEDLPMAVYTFLDSYEFSGKKIIPFCTHEGSGLSATDRMIKKACPKADVLKGLEVKGSVAQNSRPRAEKAVSDWLDKNGIERK